MYYQVLSKKELKDVLPAIWRYESKLPLWYQAASSCWTRDEANFTEFALDCWRVYGFYKPAEYMFQEDELVALVYLEKLTPEIVNIHLSVLCQDADLDTFISLCGKIRDQLFEQGVTRIVGWVMKKNFMLARLIGRIGFHETGLRMDRGISHGTILRWECMEATA
jgi:hypothetical protein